MLCPIDYLDMWIRAVDQLSYKSGRQFSGSHIRTNIAKLNGEVRGVGFGGWESSNSLRSWVLQILKCL